MIPDYLKKPKSFYSISNVVSRYKRKDLIEKLKKFVSETRPSRFPGTSGHKNSVPWLATQVSKNLPGINVEIQEFEPDWEYAKNVFTDDFNNSIKTKYTPEQKEYIKYQNYTNSMLTHISTLKGIKGRNIIWEKKGTTDKKILIIGAHFDSFAIDKEKMIFDRNLSMPGADDNASGVAALLALIEILEQIEIKRTIRIVFFDMHELGFLGSKAYVEGKKKTLLTEVDSYINVEMIGHDTKIKDLDKKFKNFKIYIRDKNHQNFKEELNFAKNIVERGKKTRSPLKVEISQNNYDFSDHRFFWKNGVLALTFSQNFESDFNERNHTENDFPETLNMKTYYQAFQFLAGSVLSLAFDIDR